MMTDDWAMVDLMAGIEFLLDDLDRVCRQAFTIYRGYDPAVLLDHDTRAQAACIYSHIAADAARRWPPQNLISPTAVTRPQVVPLEVRGLKVWAVRDFAVLRFKKHDEDGRSQNYPTRQAKDYDRGAPLVGIPSPAARLSIGYLLDATGTQFIRTQIARPRGREIEWCAAVVLTSERVKGERIWIDVTRQSGL